MKRWKLIQKEHYFSQLAVQAVIIIWLCQLRCFAKILYAKSRIDKIPYAKIPTDKIPYAESALCQNSNCPNALQPILVKNFCDFLNKIWNSGIEHFRHIEFCQLEFWHMEF